MYKHYRMRARHHVRKSSTVTGLRSSLHNDNRCANCSTYSSTYSSTYNSDAKPDCHTDYSTNHLSHRSPLCYRHALVLDEFRGKCNVHTNHRIQV